MHSILLLLHVLAATIWTGGHLVLATTILPRAFREQSTVELQRFEAGYEWIGMPALGVQIVTGLLMAHDLAPDIGSWFRFEAGPAFLIGCKLVLLGLTALLAIDARLRVIPRLSPERLTDLAWHVVPVTIIGVLFVAHGVAFRAGWF